jgi:hypothetical protein
VDGRGRPWPVLGRIHRERLKSVQANVAFLWEEFGGYFVCVFQDAPQAFPRYFREKIKERTAR